MKTNTIIFLLQFIVPFTSIYAQQTKKNELNSFYFVCGSTADAFGDEYYESWLLKLNPQKNKLDTLQQITNETESLEYLQVYNEHGFLVYQTDKNVFFEDTKRFYKIDFKNPTKLDSLKLNFGKGTVIGILPGPMLLKKPTGLFFALGVVGDDFILKTKSINLSTWKIGEEDKENYKYAYLVGLNFVHNGGIEGLSCKLYKKKQIILPVTYDFSKRPIFPINIDSNLVSDKKIVGIDINNDYFTSIAIFEESGFSESNKSAIKLIFNKQTKESYIWKQNGNSNTYLSFKNWIVGSVSNTVKEADFKPSIGKSFRKQNRLRTNRTFDYKALINKLEFEGKLFLFDTSSKQYIEINTKQGDSEILLVQNNKVYYRVYDTIYEGEIGKTKIENIKRIIKNPLVQDIHWAFFER